MTNPLIPEGYLFTRRYTNYVFSLLFLLYMFDYVDRMVISSLFPFLKAEWNLTDTQCGFKLYRGDIARQLYAECTTDGFMFDIEIVLRALRHGYRIAEFPVEWTCDRNSRLGVRRNSREIMRELLQIKRALLPRRTRGRT